MCLTISYLYTCGHTEEEIFELEAVVCDTDGCICERMEEQSVVMSIECVGCRQARAEDEPCELALDEHEQEWLEIAW